MTVWPETLWPGQFCQNDALARVTDWPVTLWPETLWPETLWPERHFGQRHFGCRDSLASDILASDTWAGDTLARGLALLVFKECCGIVWDFLRMSWEFLWNFVTLSLGGCWGHLKLRLRLNLKNKGQISKHSEYTDNFKSNLTCIFLSVRAKLKNPLCPRRLCMLIFLCFLGFQLKSTQ